VNGNKVKLWGIPGLSVLVLASFGLKKVLRPSRGGGERKENVGRSHATRVNGALGIFIGGGGKTWKNIILTSRGERSRRDRCRFGWIRETTEKEAHKGGNGGNISGLPRGGGGRESNRGVNEGASCKKKFGDR